MASVNYKNGFTSVVYRAIIVDSTTGIVKTGLSKDTAGLIISTITDNEAAATAYTQAGSTIETITTLGTFATPTATKCRFKEVDPTNHPGLYEFQFDNARFAVSNARALNVQVSGGSAHMVAKIQQEPVPANVLQLGDGTQSATDLKDFADDGYDPGTNKVTGVVLVDTTSAVTNGVNVTQLAGVTQSLTDLKDFADTGYDPSTHKVQGVVLVDTVTTVTNRVTANVDQMNGSSQSLLDLKDFADDGYDPSQNQVVSVATVINTTNVINGVNVSQLGGDSQSLADLKDFADDGYNPLLNQVTAVDIVTTVLTTGTTVNLTNLPSIPADWLTGTGIHASAVTKIQAGLASQTSVDDLPTNAELATALAAADDAVLAAISALNNLSAAQVAVEISDALSVDAIAELASVPAANAPLAQKIAWIFLLARNKITEIGTLQSVFADNGSTLVGSAITSDLAGTTTRGEFS